MQSAAIEAAGIVGDPDPVPWVLAEPDGAATEAVEADRLGAAPQAPVIAANANVRSTAADPFATFITAL
jgi:hypothetical protein